MILLRIATVIPSSNIFSVYNRILPAIFPGVLAWIYQKFYFLLEVCRSFVLDFFRSFCQASIRRFFFRICCQSFSRDFAGVPFRISGNNRNLYWGSYQHFSRFFHSIPGVSRKILSRLLPIFFSDFLTRNFVDFLRRYSEKYSWNNLCKNSWNR